MSDDGVCLCVCVCVEVALALRCPASKFITHTLSHMSFLFLLAAATFRLDGATHPISFNMTGIDWTPVVLPPMSSDDVNYAESVENVIKSTFRPANILMTNVQICLMFWIFGSFSCALFASINDHFSGPHRAIGRVCVCPCVSCVSIVRTITFELHDL